MVQKFNQAGIACVCSDAMNLAIRKSMNLPQDQMLNIPPKWWDANRACTKLAPGWGAKANYDAYDAHAYYESLVNLKDVAAKIVEQTAGKEALKIYWSEVETRQKKIWRDYR